jgi:hypothetical protein
MIGRAVAGLGQVAKFIPDGTTEETGKRLYMARSGSGTVRALFPGLAIPLRGTVPYPLLDVNYNFKLNVHELLSHSKSLFIVTVRLLTTEPSR